jgi:hypothetical protein
MKFAKIAVLVFVLCPLAVKAQKIKYDDLFMLLNSGAYDQAEPTLKLFLAESKNSDHANGHYQMGAILEKRFYGKDILGDTALISKSADSAIVFFKKAIELITEKELKRNDELYQNFYRRDLRTGEFGIKISDVHLDIEKKIENINARKKAIRDFRTMLLRINGRRNLSAMLYKQMVAKSPVYRDLLFSLKEDDLVSLDRMKDNAQGLYELINELKAAAKNLGSTYYQGFQDFKVIEKYGEDGISQEDLFGGELELWDYETWATATRNDFFAVKQYLVNLSSKKGEIFDAHDKLDQGLDPGEISLEEIRADAERYDPDGVAMQLLELKKERVQINRLTNPAVNEELQDSTNVYARFHAAKTIVDKMAIMEEEYSLLSAPAKIKLAKTRYVDIINERYGGPDGFDQFMATLGGWITANKAKWQIAAVTLTEREKYAISGSDTIQLFPSNMVAIKKKGTLLVAGEAKRVAAGLDKEKGEGFIVWSGPERRIDAQKSFVTSMPNPNVKSGIIPSASFACYIFNPDLTENNLTIVSTGDVGVIKWSNVITAPNEPVSFRYDATLDQMTIFYFPEDQLPTDGRIGYVVIDRTGAVR